MDGQPLQLPYFAPKSRLPIPIPAVQDIECDAVVLHERDGRRVARFGNHFVIKYGSDVSLTEGENMLFVRQTQPLLAPEIFALFSVETDHGRVNYIIMENVAGDRLDQVWDRFGTPEKCRLAGTLRLQIETLRKIPAPGYFGCVGRRPFEENMFWAASEDGILEEAPSGEEKKYCRICIKWGAQPSGDYPSNDSCDAGASAGRKIPFEGNASLRPLRRSTLSNDAVTPSERITFLTRITFCNSNDFLGGRTLLRILSTYGDLSIVTQPRCVLSAKWTIIFCTLPIT
ncbi:hypothetical protein E4U52_000467 [Claviceps spartinae]|nr:hypothetical protein E4U52_000467 [Claviceps spartinae]